MNKIPSLTFLAAAGLTSLGMLPSGLKGRDSGKLPVPLATSLSVSNGSVVFSDNTLLTIVPHTMAAYSSTLFVRNDSSEAKHISLQLVLRDQFGTVIASAIQPTTADVHERSI